MCRAELSKHVATSLNKMEVARAALISVLLWQLLKVHFCSYWSQWRISW